MFSFSKKQVPTRIRANTLILYYERVLPVETVKKQLIEALKKTAAFSYTIRIDNFTNNIQITTVLLECPKGKKIDVHSSMLRVVSDERTTTDPYICSFSETQSEFIKHFVTRFSDRSIFTVSHTNSKLDEHSMSTPHTANLETETLSLEINIKESKKLKTMMIETITTQETPQFIIKHLHIPSTNLNSNKHNTTLSISTNIKENILPIRR